ncbi:putative N-acetyltransferase [Teratosphaeria destructans]|uniref:N-alpha-acetyltransferase 40 n=1 Tax=Teratosphaeria destructans TaxID=418781 RepID=A0A9W7SYK1_9PEZI|nr:putative N-acetyltransferase [Teratosphaeria destructans]
MQISGNMSKRKTASNDVQNIAKKKRKTAGEELIDSANDLPISDFKTRYVEGKWLTYQPSTKRHSPGNPIFNISLKSASELTEQEFTACFNLIKTTSRHDYENSSFGWHVKRKKREMKESEMRYLLVRQRKRVQKVSGAERGPVQTADLEHGEKPISISQERDWIDEDDRNEDAPVEAFLSFMLTHDSSPPVPVLYVYEIHLASALRSCGLGTHLMAAAEHIASRVGVQMVMLTCFLSNVTAKSFYERKGYVKDVCSPEDRKTRERVIEVDYVIMSKVL